MSIIGRQLTLQVAYQISENLADHDTSRLFWAMDRFWADRDTVNADSQYQRSEARQRLAVELDRRNVPLRNPDAEKAAVAKIVEELGLELAD